MVEIFEVELIGKLIRAHVWIKFSGADLRYQHPQRIMCIVKLKFCGMEILLEAFKM